MNNNLVKVAGLNISPLTKTQFLEQVKSLLSTRQQTFITTPNSEFLYAAITSDQDRDLLNKASIAIPDGIGILWAERFLAMPLHFSNILFRFIEVMVQVVVSGARIIFTPQYLYKNIPEKITGADVFIDLAKLASNQNYSIFLLGNWADSAKKTTELLQHLFPNIKIAGYSNKLGNDSTLLPEIKLAKPDIIFVGFGPVKQEQWIDKNLPELDVKLAMGVGGTFDYFSGNKLRPPQWVRSIGLEWLFRLITQPYRFKRIYTAVIGLISVLVRYKLKLKIFEKTS